MYDFKSMLLGFSGKGKKKKIKKVCIQKDQQELYKKDLFVKKRSYKKRVVKKDNTIYRWLSAKNVTELAAGYAVSVQINGQRISLKKRVKTKKGK